MSDEVIDWLYLSDQFEWSQDTFGPGARTKGIISHIRKELREIRKNPDDISEWADVVILGFDGAMRAGHSGQDIIDAIRAKQRVNEKRRWPEWKNFSQDEAIEHIDIK